MHITLTQYHPFGWLGHAVPEEREAGDPVATGSRGEPVKTPYVQQLTSIHGLCVGRTIDDWAVTGELVVLFRASH